MKRIIAKLLNRAAFPWGQAISLYCAFTFIMLDVDMALLHLGYRHFRFMAVMPLVFSLLAAIVCLATTFSPWLRRQAWVVGVLTLLVGGIGTVFHLELAVASLESSNLQLILAHLIFDPRPPLAPAALAGAGLLMIFVALAERWPQPACAIVTIDEAATAEPVK
ncbi:MAG: hypothetical protein ACYDBB_07130 [Armatimonadota bacterium]